MQSTILKIHRVAHLLSQYQRDGFCSPRHKHEAVIEDAHTFGHGVRKVAGTAIGLRPHVSIQDLRSPMRVAHTANIRLRRIAAHFLIINS
jgi:hypothetical protein